MKNRISPVLIMACMMLFAVGVEAVKNEQENAGRSWTITMAIFKGAPVFVGFLLLLSLPQQFEGGWQKVADGLGGAS